MVAAAVVTLIIGYSTLISVVFGLFVTSFEADFGWSRTEISVAATLVTAIGVLTAPLAGMLVDRFGVRRLLLPSQFAFGLGLCAISLLEPYLWQLYLLFAVLSAVGLGTQPVVLSRLIVNWFDAHRGLALGITLSGVGLASVALPALVQFAIGAAGWRTAFLMLGGLVLAVAWPISFLVIRDPPDAGATSAAAARISRRAEGFTLRQAFGRRSFWQILAAFLVMGVVSTAVITHLAPMAADRGLSAAAISLLLGLKGVAVIVGRLACGILIDRFFAPFVASAFLILTGVGIGILATSDSVALLAAAITLIGLGLGAEFDLMAYLISRFLGLFAYGRIYGLVYGAFSVGASGGPVLMGWSYDQLGSYAPVLAVLAAAPVVAGLLLATLGTYNYGLAVVAAPVADPAA